MLTHHGTGRACHAEQWVLRESNGGLSWTKAKRPNVALLSAMIVALASGEDLTDELFNGYRAVEVVVKVKQKSRATLYEEYSDAWDEKWEDVDDDAIPADQGKRLERSFANRVVMLKAITELKEADAREEFMNRTVEDLAVMCKGMTVQEAYDKHIDETAN